VGEKEREREREEGPFAMNTACADKEPGMSKVLGLNQRLPSKRKLLGVRPLPRRELKVSRSSDEWDSKSAMKAEIGEQRRCETQSAKPSDRERRRRFSVIERGW